MKVAVTEFRAAGETVDLGLAESVGFLDPEVGDRKIQVLSLIHISEPTRPY